MQTKWSLKKHSKNKSTKDHWSGPITFRTPTRNENSMICFIFIGKTVSIVFKSDENRAKMRPNGIVSKNRWDVPKIPFNKLWCSIVAAFNVPCAKAIGPNMIAITVGFMTSELHVAKRKWSYFSKQKWERERNWEIKRKRERRKIYGLNGKRQTYATNSDIFDLASMHLDNTLSKNDTG